MMLTPDSKRLFTVPTEGGDPHPMTPPGGTFALITPSGSAYAYTFERAQTDPYLVTGLK